MKIKFESTYTKWGITIFLALSATIIFYFSINNASALAGAFDTVQGILSPFIYGLVLAYLLCPIFNIITRRLYSLMLKKFKNNQRALSFAKAFSTLISIVLAFVVVFGLISMVLPQLITSITGIIKSLPENINGLIEWAGDIFKLDQSTITSASNTIQTKLMDLMQVQILPQIIQIFTGITTSVFSGVMLVKDIFIGVIICIYFLNSKETFTAQSKKILYAALSKKNADIVIRESRFINKTFGGFISGKLLDSLIIGLICFPCLLLLKMPYALLISVIIGVTNIIPFFGPFIGAIPSAILILLVSPIKCLYFMVFVLILQQVDGNIIGPKILGDSTGLPSFWVMFAVILGGGLFGFIGMIVGIPIFAVLYSFTSRLIKLKLADKGLKINTKEYENLELYNQNSDIN